MSRRLRPPAALAMIALIGAGCSSTASENGNAGSARKASTPHQEKALRFAECMRDHGVKAFPDPNAAGQLTVDAIANGTSVDTSSPAFNQALGACKDLEPAGFTGRKRTTQQQEKALRYAQCIRDHGVKDFPDPTPGQPLIDTRRIPSTDQPGGMSVLHAAMQKCGDFVSGLVKRP